MDKSGSHVIVMCFLSDTGRGMNAAFAIGRLCDMEIGRKRLLLLSDSERMVCTISSSRNLKSNHFYSAENIKDISFFTTEL